MIHAIDSLLADHKLIRKLLEALDIDNPRFSVILKTLHRAVAGHAWFEDQIFLPVMKIQPIFNPCFIEALSKEHQDIEQLLTQLKSMDALDKGRLEPVVLQFRVVLNTHFTKEEEALFPLAERVITKEGFHQLGQEMKNRQNEIRYLVEP